jgi:hypothetical protein
MMTDFIVMPTNDEVIEVVKSKQEIAKQKKKEYMKEYMKIYHKKRMETDENYREYRTKINRENSVKAHNKYKQACNYFIENNISISA